MTIVPSGRDDLELEPDAFDGAYVQLLEAHGVRRAVFDAAISLADAIDKLSEQLFDAKVTREETKAAGDLRRATVLREIEGKNEAERNAALTIALDADDAWRGCRVALADCDDAIAYFERRLARASALLRLSEIWIRSEATR